MPLLQDIRFGVRTLAQSPAASLAAVLALALGIGANISSFIGVNSMVLHPLPYSHLDRIVTLWETVAKTGNDRDVLAPANYLDWQNESTSFQAIAAVEHWDANLTGGALPIRVAVARVTSAFFQVLGMQPALGRTFLTDPKAGQNRDAVVSYGFWKQQLAGDRDVIGRSIALNGEAYTVVGVMPEEFDYPLTNQIWTPLTLSGKDEGERSEHRLQVLALLRPGVSFEQAQEEAGRIAAGLERQFPRTNENRGLTLVPLLKLTNEVTDRFVLFLFGAALFVLLLATANVANLQLARGLNREREIAVRAALGASRFQIARQLTVESILLALAGGLCGLVLAAWNLDLTKANIPAAAFRFVTGLRTMHVDFTVVVYTIGISLVAGLLASLPASLQLLWQRGGDDLNALLQKGGRTSPDFGGRNRLQSTLIVFEVSIALVLLIGAMLMVKAFHRVLAAPYGYNPNNVLEMEVSLPKAQYQDDAQMVSFYDRALQKLQALPGAQNASAWSEGPDVPMFVEGRAAPGPGDWLPEVEPVSSEFLQSMQMPLLAGRFLSERDRPGTPRVAVLSAALARHYWPHSNPIGQRIRLEGPASPWVTVVGVCGDFIRNVLTNEPAHLIYVAYTQMPTRATTLLVRTARDPAQLGHAAQAAIAGMDQTVAVYNVESMQQAALEGASGIQAAADAMTRYGLVALLLAATGIFGVIACFVAQRTRDIGIRMALGADTQQVLGMTLRRSLFPAVIGVVAGTGAAYGVSRLMSNVLYVVRMDSSAFLLCAAALLLIASLASYIPARRAMKVDPMIALRDA